MNRPYVLIVQGAPATGKTTIARRLSQDLALGLVSKDDFKELLYMRLGAPTERKQSSVYGQAAIRAIFSVTETFVKSGRSLVLESAFQAEFAQPDLAAIKMKCDVDYIQIFCHTDAQTQLDRFNARIADGTRHAGHPDDTTGTTDDFIKNNNRYEKLDIDKTIDVDTTEFGDQQYSQLLIKIHEMVKE